MVQQELELVETGDGSKTLYSTVLNEIYHSRHGALTESTHVFINNGLKFVDRTRRIRILEIGFGTGLNFILTVMEARRLRIMFDYVGLEPFPLPLEIIRACAYSDLLAGANSEWVESLYQGGLRTEEYMTALLCDEGLMDHEPSGSYDLVYFDAFGPATQPELWTEEAIQKCASLMTLKGVLVTYCAKGQVRRNMIKAGFEVEKLSGPPGKREMLRAVKRK